MACQACQQRKQILAQAFSDLRATFSGPVPADVETITTDAGTARDYDSPSYNSAGARLPVSDSLDVSGVIDQPELPDTYFDDTILGLHSSETEDSSTIVIPGQPLGGYGRVRVYRG